MSNLQNSFQDLRMAESTLPFTRLWNTLLTRLDASRVTIKSPLLIEATPTCRIISIGNQTGAKTGGFSGVIRFPQNNKYNCATPFDNFLLVDFGAKTATWLPVEPSPCPPNCQVYPLGNLMGDLIIPRI